MGLFTFVKDAGAKLFGMDTTEETNENKENQIKTFVSDFGFGVSDFNVNVDTEKATLTGTANTSEEKEKLILAVGNIQGITSVEDNISVTDNTPAAEFYTVQSGDTLGKVAKSFYGNPSKYTVIFEANRPMLKDPDLIYPGQVLRIPSENATIA